MFVLSLWVFPDDNHAGAERVVAGQRSAAGCVAANVDDRQPHCPDHLGPWLNQQRTGRHSTRPSTPTRPSTASRSFTALSSALPLQPAALSPAFLLSLHRLSTAFHCPFPCASLPSTVLSPAFHCRPLPSTAPSPSFNCPKAKEYIRSRRGDPWCLHLSLWRPHPPWANPAPCECATAVLVSASR